MSEQPSTAPEHSDPELKNLVEALLLAAGEPLTIARIAAVFDESDAPSSAEIGRALEALAADLESRGIELVEVASGYRLQTRAEMTPWVQRLWEERPQRYSRALLETLALIAYRQPITRGEIEEVRGVSVSSSIVRTLQEREWIRVVGHRDVPGKPALFGTTKAFLDYFNLKNLDDLPTLAEIRDMENLEPEFDFEAPPAADGDQPPDTDASSGEPEDDAGEAAASAADGVDTDTAHSSAANDRDAGDTDDAARGPDVEDTEAAADRRDPAAATEGS